MIYHFNYFGGVEFSGIKYIHMIVKLYFPLNPAFLPMRRSSLGVY